ncbi:class I SAM-dependent methyltransferase [Kineococcus sp. LSe6-4]|uniref:Class I SAM-dependent methyltransferase n=1 Tax=Kineococcus halophytocola TaxID=3234027 RepID=A0ABV4GV83_9ACTN
MRDRVLARCDAFNAAHPWDHDAAYHGWIERRLPPRFGSALDVGCGTGEFTRRLARRADRVTGIDVDPGIVRTAAEPSTGPGIEFRCGDLLSADLPGRYDVVTALAVLHHVPLEAGLTRLRDLVAPGGTLVVLGVPREAGFLDSALGVVAVPANLLVGAVRTRRRSSAVRPVAMTAPTAPSTATFRQVREVARRVVPGARTRRHLFWRYSLVWTADDAGS